MTRKILGLAWLAVGGLFIACSGVATRTSLSDADPRLVGGSGPSSDGGKPCTAGSYICDGQTLLHCSGEGELEFGRECAKSEYCDSRRAQCQPQICKPGAASCDGAKIQVCSDDGSELVPKRLCALSQVCVSGECVDIACVPKSSFCADGNVWKCGADGTTSAPVEHCASGQYCLEREHSASCSATVCFAGDGMCVGNLATECKPDGSGPKPGGSDCAAAKQICYEGECRDPVCTPGLKLCDGNSLYLCSEAGAGRTLISKCGDTSSCDSMTGACQPRICEAGKLGCDGSRVVSCNASGTGWLQSGPDCAESHALCTAGMCKPIVCTANQTFCQDGNVYQCNVDGTSSVLQTDCSAWGVNGAFHCVSSGTFATCNSYFCQPSAAGCNGNLLTTCKADGTAWVAGGTDCSLTGAVCSSAQCKPKICTPSTLLCEGNDVQLCDSLGVSSSRYKTCGYATYCKAQGNSADCAATPCVPDTNSCLAEKYGYCASDGMSVSDDATDCAASGLVCNGSGCAASAVDTIASADGVGASSYHTIVNVMDVRTSRKLTTIETYLSLPANRTLTFVVYQKSFVGNQPSYELKFQKVVSASGSGFQSSGEISYELEANRTYGIGVNVSGGSFAYYYDRALNFSLTSFASLQGGYYYNELPSSTTYTYPQLTQIYHQRLTTTLP